MPYAKATCKICKKRFVPIRPSRRNLMNGLGTYEWCPECRREGDATPGEDYAEMREGGPIPSEPVHNTATGDGLHPPLVQAVFDIETYGLDRGWGVMMVASIMLHTGGPQPEFYTFDLTETETWKQGKRSCDKELAAKTLAVLDRAHILYAHNGDGFDVRWLRSLSLKYGLPFNEKKLIDPARIAWAKYAIGRNSLGALSNFLFPDNPELRKMPVPEEVWRRAILDGDVASWQTLRTRCESDVRLLNAVAGRVTRDVGMIDFRGSAFR